VAEQFKDILETLVNLQREVNRTFWELWKKFPEIEMPAITYEPPVDIEELEDKYIVYVDVPGYDKNEIRIKATDSSIVIKAEKSEEKIREERGRNFLEKQRIYKGILKKVEFPEKIIPNQIKAILKNGVIEIHVPKAGISKEVEILIE